MKGYLSYNINNKKNAQTLRKTMTDAETLLWSKIRRKQICNTQFYRQKSIANYIVDFYSSSAKIVIEIDGGQHFEPEHMQRDRKRDAFLNHLGLTVLRFDNSQILRELDTVLEAIFMKVEASYKSPLVTSLLDPL